jgi:hypothetical protein
LTNSSRKFELVLVVAEYISAPRLLVKRRQRRVAEMVARSAAIVSDLFPIDVIVDCTQDEYAKGRSKTIIAFHGRATQIDSLLFLPILGDEAPDDTSIADTYPCKL